MKQATVSVECYTKIQQAQPSYCSTLVNKEIGLNVNVELDQVYKIKDCVDSTQSNAELYKRFSKHFISNIKKSINQFFLFCGNDTLSRLESSIGLKRNPGLFMISAIGILDEKYQNQYINYDVEVAFLEYVDGCLYDLLIKTGKPLEMLKEENNISFGESYTKITTFDQFLKIFKIALFNNKQRDFKSEKCIYSQETRSTMIMIIATKIYDQNQLKIQKNIFLDFGLSESNSARNLWEYFIIDLNNLTNKKKMFYHLTQPNPLLSLMKHHLYSSKTFIIFSFSANPQKFKENYKQLEEVRELVDLTNPIQIHQKITKEDSTKLEEIATELIELQTFIRQNTYKSLRQFRQLREQCKKIIQDIKSWIIKTQKIITSQLENRCQIKLAENSLIHDQIELIGFCVKSDHYKDFYNAKSYIFLERQVRIKTQEIRTELENLYRTRDSLNDRLNFIRNKQISIKNTQSNSIKELKVIGQKICDYFRKIFLKILFEGERTVVNEIVKGISIKNDVEFLFKNLKQFLVHLYENRKEKSIASNQQVFKDTHLFRLVREINKSKKKCNKKHEKRKEIKSRDGSQKFTKLPTLDSKSININGSFKILDLLITPDQEI